MHSYPVDDPDEPCEHDRRQHRPREPATADRRLAVFIVQTGGGRTPVRCIDRVCDQPSLRGRPDLRLAAGGIECSARRFRDSEEEPPPVEHGAVHTSPVTAIDPGFQMADAPLGLWFKGREQQTRAFAQAVAAAKPDAGSGPTVKRLVGLDPGTRALEIADCIARLTVLIRQFRPPLIGNKRRRNRAFARWLRGVRSRDFVRTISSGSARSRPSVRRSNFADSE